MSTFASWTDGLLQGSVALTVLMDRGVCDQIKDEAGVAARVEECAQRILGSSRAEERSQGRRRLIEVVGETVPTLALRFPAVFDGFIALAKNPSPELRTLLESSLEGLVKAGAKTERLDELRAAMDGSRPQLRDPTHYRGTTRGRGRKAEGRSDAKGRADAARKREY